MEPVQTVTVSNTLEMTEEILRQFSINFPSNEGYHPYIIKINEWGFSFFNDNINVLDINFLSSTVTVKDVIKDAIQIASIENELKNQELIFKPVIDKLFKNTNDDTLHGFGISSSDYMNILTRNLMDELNLVDNYAEFNYYSTYEETFQRSTVNANVLSFECYEYIQTIKEKMLQYLKDIWE